MPPQPNPFPFGIDPCDPEFRQQSDLWVLQMRSDMMEIIVRSQETIATSKDLLLKVDRMLAFRLG